MRRQAGGPRGPRDRPATGAGRSRGRTPRARPAAADASEELDRLRELVAAFYQVNSSLDLDTVLGNTLAAATKLMQAEAASIALISDDGSHLEFVQSTDQEVEKLKGLRVPLNQGIAGHVAATGESVRVEDAREDHRFYGAVDAEMGRRTRSYLCVALRVADEVVGTAQLINRRDGRGFTAGDLALMEGFARQAALAIANARLHQLKLEQRALESELEVCAAIQRRLLPAADPALDGFEIFGTSSPCRDVGGDYYAYIERPDGGIDVFVADVSGKGLPAAMVVSDLHAAMRLLARADQRLDVTVEQLNRHLRASLLESKFITLFGARLAPGSSRLEYVVAGHPAPFIVSPSGSIRRLGRGGPVLGVLAATFQVQEAELAPGDLLVAFTDGYSEAENRQGEEFGEERIAREVAGWPDFELAGIQRRLQAGTEAFRDGTPRLDDETLLLVRRLAG